MGKAVLYRQAGVPTYLFRLTGTGISSPDGMAYAKNADFFAFYAFFSKFYLSEELQVG